MLDKDKPVQGYVVYAEFRKDGQTRQVFFTPDGFTTSGHFVAMRAHYRTISKDFPRKQWKTTHTDGIEIRDTLAAAERGEEYSVLKFTQDWAKERVSIINRYFDYMMTYDWTPIGTPLVVEASKHDMDDISALKTPTKIIYRINQTRTAAGFPADLF